MPIIDESYFVTLTIYNIDLDSRRYLFISVNNPWESVLKRFCWDCRWFGRKIDGFGVISWGQRPETPALRPAGHEMLRKCTMYLTGRHPLNDVLGLTAETGRANGENARGWI